MGRLQPLEFTDCISDSPYFRENLHAHEKELERTSLQIKRLVKEVKDLLSAAKNLSRAQRTLSNTLQNFSFECTTEQTDDEQVISHSFGEFGRLIATIEDERDRMMDRAYEQIILPLENFRKEHIGGVKEGKKKFEKQTAKFCQSQERYLNLSTKKQDAYLQEADATLEMEQRYFFQASLEYVFLLQQVQERKKFEFVETLLTFMLGWLTFYHEGHEVGLDFKPFMNELQLKIQKTRENFNATKDKTESLMKKTLEMRLTKPVDAGSAQKANAREGYLFLMEKKAFGTTWTKQYCMYNKETKEFLMIPYNQMTGKLNTSEKIILGSCVRRMSDTIEKRFCFDLTPVDRPGAVFTLQALSEEDRKQWMDVMDGKEPTYGVPVPLKPVKMEEKSVLDDVGFAFVTKCIDVLECRGLEEQGLYRVVGVSSKVNKLLSMGLDKRKIEKLNLEDPLEWESKTVTSALKTYLRNLPEPLMTFRFHESFIIAAKQENTTLRLKEIHSLVHRLPSQNIKMLDKLIKHLHNVCIHADKNLMTVSNLGVCFGPTLLRPEEETVAAIMDIKFCNVVVEILIKNYAKIFKTQPEPLEQALEQSSSTSEQPQPVPRHKYHQNPASVVSQAVSKPFYDGTGPLASNLSSSLMNVTTSVNPSEDHYANSSPGRGTGFPRTTTNVSAYSEGNLLSVSPVKQPHSVYPSPQDIRHNIYGSSGFFSDPLNSTSSSNESVSSLTPRDASTSSLQKSTIRKSQEHCLKFPLNQKNVRVRTLYACLGENDGELSFEPNQIITNVRSSLEPGWLEGTLNGKTGLVPENYVELLP
ncbi:rho GTPase-activating protein 26 isoform X2 [Halyomorpha halys]|uniref:rho GTPase-activating protein 26 isoform X2 n=1 Tax=Halyomorpha halys TaxID=286706 RepID=UPI0006D4C976|nr:rho GTPase-activating protein 26 [Halyomorpha halys]